jgi:hypothetical protein
MAVRPLPNVAPLAQALTVQAVLTFFIIHLELFLQVVQIGHNKSQCAATKTKRAFLGWKQRRFTQTGSGYVKRLD